jgi:hypothetical protein
MQTSVIPDPRPVRIQVALQDQRRCHGVPVLLPLLPPHSPFQQRTFSGHGAEAFIPQIDRHLDTPAQPLNPGLHVLGLLRFVAGQRQGQPDDDPPDLQALDQGADFAKPAGGALGWR